MQGFDEELWAARRFDLVTLGNIAKFRQNGDLGRHLLDTGDDVLVEASPLDRIWGIGLGQEAAKDPRIAAEGRFTLSCRYENNVVRVVACRSI